MRFLEGARDTGESASFGEGARAFAGLVGPNTLESHSPSCLHAGVALTAWPERAKGETPDVLE